MELSENHKVLLERLEKIRHEMQIMLQKETKSEFPKEFFKIADALDKVITDLKDYVYE